jgi:hypothetical protein
MSPSPRHPIRTAITAAAAFLGLLLLVTLWTVYGPAYDAQAAPLTSPATTTSTGEPCPEGTATGGTCGSEGQIAGPTAPAPDTAPQTTETPTRRCKGCRLTQEEYDARQADKQAAHDRAQARRQRGAERRAQAQLKREERAARKSSPTKPSSKSSSSRSHASDGLHAASSAPESSSDASQTQDGTSTPADTSEAAQDADSAASDSSPADDSDAPAASAPYTPLDIPEASRKPAPYDASKDPFEVRREAARQAADAVNHAPHPASTNSDQVKAPSAFPTTSPAGGYWAEQMPTWALGLIGFLAAAGLVAYKASRVRSRS